jgi:7-keto-8-aminopelargonate synthetase-like enzyme
VAGAAPRDRPWPLGRSTETGPRSKCLARTDEGALFEGINFASQDYLSLSAHDAVRDTAIGTINEFGVHSAGSPALVGIPRFRSRSKRRSPISSRWTM